MIHGSIGFGNKYRDGDCTAILDQSMNFFARLRRLSAVQLVGWLFFATGVVAAVRIAVVLLLERRITIDFDVLGLWIGPGLLRHEARYRVWAMRLLVLSLCIASIAAVALIFAPGPLQLKIFGQPAGTVSLSLALTALALLESVSVWQYWVLRKPDVRALFSAARTEDAEASV